MNYLKVSGLISLIISIAVVGGIWKGGGFGSRGVREEYSFKYSGKQAKVYADDRILGEDECYVSIEGMENTKDRLRGDFTTDDGKRVCVGNSWYFVQDK